MPSPDDALRRIEALAQVAVRLATATPSGKIVLAKLASLLELDMLPSPGGDRIRGELQAALASAAEPLPFPVVEGILRAAWGGAPTGELTDLDPEPYATTPTSQVHRGTLDGAAVAVKVLRPGIAAAARQDLALLDSLTVPLARAFPQIDPQALLREVRERVMDELDLEHEAGLQRRVHRALRNHPRLAAPSPVMRLAHEQVLVSQWVDGTPVLELSDQRDRDRAATLLAVFVLGGLRAGIVDADSDPADLLLTGDGRLAVLDYGSACVVDPARGAHGLAVVEAFARGDGAGLGIALQSLGVLPAHHGPAAFDLATHTLAELGAEAPSRLDADAVIAAVQRLGVHPEQAIELLLEGGLQPEDLWPARAIAQLFATIARIGATAPWRTIVTAALTDGWDAAL